MDIICRKLANEMIYAYHNGRFWRWDEGRSIWKESHLMAQKFERARAALKTLTPEVFFSDGAEFALMDEYEISLDMTAALRDAKPCKNAPVDPVEEDTSSDVPAPAHSEDVAAKCGNTPLAPSFDFSALGDLSEQAAAADQQFDLHYGAAQDEYLISCIYLARIHALTAKAGRYGGGTWTKWYESKGLGEGSVRRMIQNGEAFNSAKLAELKQLPELTRKDLNLIARSGCAAQLVEAAGDSQRVQELLAQLKAEKERADTAEKSAQNAHKENVYFKELVKSAEAQTSKDAKKREEAESRYESALADINGLTEQNDQLKSRLDAAESREEEAWKAHDKAQERVQEIEKQLEGSRQVAEAAKRRADKWQAEAKAARKQPIEAVVDEEEVDRRAAEKAWGLADARNAELAKDNASLKKQLAALQAKVSDDAQADFETANFCVNSIRAAWDTSRASYARLVGEDLEGTFQSLCGVLNSIMEEAARLCRQPPDYDGGDGDE